MNQKRNYFRQFLASIIILMGAFALSSWLGMVLPGPRHTPWYYVVALLPLTLAALLVGFAAARGLALAIREMDELQQRIQLEAFAFSLAGTVILSFPLALFEWLSLTPVNYIFVPAIVFFLWSVGFLRARERYQ